jgi:hypothetical protein
LIINTFISGIPECEILEGGGTLVSFDLADVIYVNAGCTRRPKAGSIVSPMAGA